MGKTKIKLNSKRVFSEQFRKSRVKEYESGTLTVKEICDLYSINNVSVYRWIYQYSTYNKKGYKVVEENKSGQHKIKDLLARIKDMEGIIGRKQIKIDYLEKMIEIASKEYGIDVKKNYDSTHLTGSESTDKC